MSRNTKFLLRDVRPHEQPEDSYPFGKNGIQHNIKGVVENEPGFRLSEALLPYRYCGVINTSKFPVIFSADGTYSAIGYYDDINDQYIPIINDDGAPYKLGFDPTRFITGEAATNHLGEVIIAFTDKDKFPKYLNCDNPNVATLDDFRLFPLAELPDMAVETDFGGALAPGAYYVSMKYRKSDGTETPYLLTSNVSIVTGESGSVTNKALRVDIQNADNRYQMVILAIISKISGITKVVELEPINFGSSASITAVYTGANYSTDITLEEVLISPAAYSKVGTFGQLNGALYATGLEKAPEVSMQRYANLVNIRWKSDLVDLNPVPDEVLSGKKRGMMHQEVYALYIQYSLTEGGWSRAFTIPGVPHTATSNNASALATTQSITAKVYQVEDTIPSFDAPNRKGLCGVWYNQNETYPDTVDFDSSTIGGENLRGTAVRHHRMPSIRWCKQNLYQFEAQYGRTKLDLLGIEASNIIIPAEYTDRINGYRILYAKRSLGNSTVVAQSLLMAAGRGGSPTTLTINTPDTDYLSTGGNWSSWTLLGNLNDRRPIIVDRKLFRFHSFDLLFNRPAISPTYLSMQLRHQCDGINNPLIEDFSITPGEKNGPVVYLIDYITKGNTPTAAADAKAIRKLSETQYVPHNLVSGKWKNILQEQVYGGKMSNELLDTGDVSFHQTYYGSTSYQPPAYAANKEVTYLTNLMNLKTDVYLPHNAQSLVLAGTKRGFTSETFFSGDTFANDYCFHTYGWADALNRSHESTSGMIGSVKAARRFVCESASNINARFQIAGNEYSKWYPKFPLIPGEPTNYLTLFRRDVEPNQFGYNKDLNSLNDLISTSIFNPGVEVITKFPHRVHRGGKLSKQTVPRSWRTFLPLDYYELAKNHGLPIKLEGMDDRLLIHMENALYLTQDKARLEGGLLSVTLGAGDIFQFEPQEGLSSKLGYAGTQHELACVRTPAGYMFIDAKQGQFFMYKGELKLANEGLNTFFRDFLKLKEVNPFIGNGFTIGYDPVYKRILVTAKNAKLTGTGKLFYEYEETPAFYAQLSPGDFVYKDGRWQKYLGVNSTVYDCPPAILPSVENQSFNVNENSINGTLVGVVAGTNIANIYIIGGNTGNAFKLDAATRMLTINNTGAIDFELSPTFALNVKAVSVDGNEDTAVITLNVINTAELPIAGNMLTNLDENTPNGTDVLQVEATEPNGDPMTFAITGGNDLGIFAINSSTGMISIVDTTDLDYETYPVHVLSISITGPGGTVTITVKFIVMDITERPVPPATLSLNILDTTSTDTVIYTLDASDPEVITGKETLSYELVSASEPGVFTVTEDGNVILNDGDVLNAGTTPVYNLLIRVRDSSPEALDEEFTLVINVKYDPATIQFSPIGPSCASTTRSWANVQVYSTKYSAVVATIPNTGTPTFGGLTVPTYPSVANHVDCGGAVSTFLSAAKSGSAIKDDCVTGAGTAVTYHVQQGKYMSTVDQATADALAQADADTNKQAYANSNGSCVI